METAKKTYSAPIVKTILIDSEISLALQSAPPDGPGELLVKNEDYFNNNPFHTNKV